MKKITTPALVYNILPYSETSLIIKAFSFHKGHISIFAKGWRLNSYNDQILRFMFFELVIG